MPPYGVLVAITVLSACLDDLDAFRFVGFSTCPSTYGPFAGPSFVVRQLDQWWNSQRLTASMERGNCFVAVQADDTILGVTEVGEYDGDLVMWKLHVLPRSQRTGVGQLLLDAVKRLAAERGRPLVTEYIAGNTRAGDFYRSQGFEEISTTTDPLDSVWLRHQPREPSPSDFQTDPAPARSSH